MRSEDKYHDAVEYIRAILQAVPNDGESWSSLGRRTFTLEARRKTDTWLGHCYLMMDELQQAYSAYQSALYNLADPKVSVELG